MTNRWQAAMRAALAPHGLTHVQYVLLASLVWLEEHDQQAAISQKDLARFADIDVMMTSQVLRVLEAKELILRAVDPQDRRARVVHPTPRGVRVASQATSGVEAADDAFFSPVEDAIHFTSDLQRLADHAKSSDPEP